jgi:hypothetical protein
MGLVRLVAIIVLAVAFLGAATVFTVTRDNAWFIGGMLAWCVSETYDYALPIGRSRRPVE